MYRIRTPENLINDWDNKRAERRVHLIRHAERRPLTEFPLAHHDSVPVTPRGWRSSFRLGRDLTQIDAIVTSPVRRCIQTAEAIRIGHAFDEPVGIVRALELPRAADCRAHAHDLAERGWGTCTAAWLRGESGPGGLPSARSVAEAILNALFGVADESSGPIIAVTHDVNILALHRHLTGEVEVVCPYLGGLTFAAPRGEPLRLTLVHSLPAA